MNDKLFDNPYTAFIVVSTAITVLVLLSRFFLKRCILLWKSTLISYIVLVALTLMGVAYEPSPLGDVPLYRVVFNVFSLILLAPGIRIYGLIQGVIKPCPSDTTAVFGWLTCAFLFYSIVIWGIMKLIKINKEPETAKNKQGDNPEKQTPTVTKT